MNQDIKKFEDLMKSDEGLRKKLQDAMQNYNGEADAESVFNNVMVPLAKEYGLSATYAEYVEYSKELEKNMADLSPEELEQVTGGGKGWGDGVNLCYRAGVGIGKTDDGFCFFGGASGTGICVVKGISTPK